MNQPLPPNQQLVASGKWPVVGESAPLLEDRVWTLTVSGLVAAPQTWTLEELKQLSPTNRVIDIHCVTRWSKLQTSFRGVLLRDVLECCQPDDSAQFLSFRARSERNHSTSLTIKDALELETLLAWEVDGEPLPEIHGGPLRAVVPGRYFYKSVKWLEHLELLEQDRLGYWEAETGYHNHADPWKEQRYLATNLDRQLVKRLLSTRDFSQHDLRGLVVDDLDLSELNAERALIRAGSFQRTGLTQANFNGANLSNANFSDADLRGATVCPSGVHLADLEGADFCGADLRGATIVNASLFGCTFVSEGKAAATIDCTTQIDEATLATLSATPLQEEYIRRQLIKDD